MRDAIILDSVANESAQERDIRSGPNLAEEVSGGRGASEARVDRNQLGVAVALGLHRPLKSAGMALGGIPAHDQHHVGVLDVDPAIGHGPASKSWSQT